MNKENQFSKVAYKAYLYIIEQSMRNEEAWKNATEEIIKSKESREKGCPRKTFIGLCEAGLLKNITLTKESNSVNYKYAKFAIGEWQKSKDISKKEMWVEVQKKFKSNIQHNGQLDVVCGLWEFINK